MRAKQVTVRYARYDNVLGWRVRVGVSRKWRGVMRGYGSTDLEAQKDLVNQIHREFGALKIIWQEEPA